MKKKDKFINGMIIEGNVLVKVDPVKFENRHVIIPDGIVVIGENCFEDVMIDAIDLPDSVRIIEKGAFLYCCALKSVTLSNNLEVIEDVAFRDCESLESINLPNSLKKIGEGAFACTGLSKVMIPKSVVNIGPNIFAGTGLISLMVHPDNKFFDSRDNCNCIIETATNTLLEGCEESIISNTISRIAPKAFMDSTIDSIKIPASVVEIGSQAFLHCNELFSICVSGHNPVYTSYPNANAIIDKSGTLLFGCKNSVIPKSVRTIGEWSFYGNTNLEALTIPKNVQEIQYHAFSHCYDCVLHITQELQEKYHDKMMVIDCVKKVIVDQ